MDQEIIRKQSFLLRLPCSIREQAQHLAHLEGTSLNHFITLAVAEKLSRMECADAAQHSTDSVYHPLLRRPTVLRAA